MWRKGDNNTWTWKKMCNNNATPHVQVHVPIALEVKFWMLFEIVFLGP